MASSSKNTSGHPYAKKPWLSLYPEGYPSEIRSEFADALAIFRSAVKRNPSGDAIRYFDGSFSYTQLNALSDSAAAWLLQNGVGRGDRVAIVLQNVPQFLIVLVGAWKVGAIAVPLNPMNRPREMELLLRDCEPKVVLCHAGADTKLVADVLRGYSKFSKITLATTGKLSFQTRNDPRVFENDKNGMCTGDDLAVIEPLKQSTPAISTDPEEAAFIVYTSGTSGLPKGAVLTHGNVAFNAQVYRDWIGLRERGPILGLAPLFHVTGLIGQIAAAFLVGAPLILTCRFQADAMLDAIIEHQPEFAIGSITAFIALDNVPRARREDFMSLCAIYSGGAAVPPAFVERFQSKFGHYIYSVYGLTETTSPSHFVPLGWRAPIDPESGCLSVGIPVFNADARIVDDHGRDSAVREPGEILTRGPMVIPRYWNKPKETAEAIQEGWLRTGDIGFMDEEGWFYLIDRKKDMINASGYKVWPREIEGVLYTHPAIREAAVVGVPDSYRGETVKAVVSLRPGSSVTAQELEAFCRKQMAAYKCPRIIEFVDELPKTASGKILRRALR